MKISVIIPTYKPGDYLFQCLDSVLCQTFPHSMYEILIILNGPKEPFFEKINAYIGINNHIKLIYTSKLGVSNARNIGIDRSLGEYLCFIDDDDIVSQFYLERLYEKSANNIIAVSNVFSFRRDIAERGNQFFICKHLQNKEKFRNASLFKSRSFLAFPVAKLIHRSIIGTRRYDTRFSNGEDSLFITSITDKLSAIEFTADDAIYYVRLREGSASRKRLPLTKIIYDSLLLIVAYIRVFISNPMGYNIRLFLSRIPGVLKNAFMLSRNTF